MERIRMVIPPDLSAMGEARRQWSDIAKPLHSLGLLEEAIVQIAGITGDADVKIDKRCVVVMCADNGVLGEGVAQSDESVTLAVAKAMAEGTSNINLMAGQFRTDVLVVDIGMKHELSCDSVFQRKIAHATNNIAKGSAMTRQQAEKAVVSGMDMVKLCKERGYQAIVTGEMGIGNTTTSSAIASVLLGKAVSEVTGRGAGLDSAGLRRKIAAIEKAIAINKPDSSDAISLLETLGGYDIAGMVGLYLGGAVYHVPVIIDGFISAVAAALAVRIAPYAADYMLASHVSQEPAGRAMLQFLGKQPLICAGMCLGEGTGGVLLLPMLDAALCVYHSVHKFEALSIEKYKEFT